MTTDARPPAAASPAAATTSPGAPAAPELPGDAVPGALAAPRPGGRVALDVTLPRAAYVDAAFFAEERERIFVREWLCVGREEELPNPGEYLLVEVASESVIVVRGTTGAFHAHYNVCRHRGCQVTLAGPSQPGVASPSDTLAPGRREAGSPPGPTGSFAGNRIRCPYHSWTYELDGRVRTAPFLSDRDDFDRAAFSLHPVGVATWGGFVFVNLEPGEAAAPGRDLASRLGEIPARVGRYPLAELRVARRIVYEVRANWKVILENYNECFTADGPPGALRARACVPAGRGRRARLGGRIPHRDGAWTFTSGGRPAGPFTGLTETERTRHFGELAYPNLMLSMAADHVAAFTLWPRARPHDDRLRRPRRLVEMPSPDDDPMDAVDFWDVVNGQDWTICEATQRGHDEPRLHARPLRAMEDLSADMRRYVGERMGRAASGGRRGPWTRRTLRRPPPPEDGSPRRARPGVGRDRRRPRRHRIRGRLLAGAPVRRPGAGPRAVRLRSTCAGRRRTTAASSGSRYHRRTTSASPPRPTRRGRPSKPTSGRAAHRAHRRPRPVAVAATEIPMADYTGSMDACGVPYERLDADEIMRRWPQWRLDPDTVGLYQEAGGIAPPILANEAHRTARRERGAVLLDEMPVPPSLDERRRSRSTPAVVTFRAPQGLPVRRRLDQRAAGPLGTTLPLTVTKEQVTYLGLAAPAGLRAERFPVWIWMDVPSFYGFPAFGEPGPRAHRTWVVDRRRRHARLRPRPRGLRPPGRLHGRHLPTAVGPVLYTKTCLYTMPPDRDFVLDTLPGARHPRRLGRRARLQVRQPARRMLAQLAFDGSTPGVDRAAFAVDQADPPRGRPPAQLARVNRLARGDVSPPGAPTGSVTRAAR